MSAEGGGPASPAPRPPAVADTFYPGPAGELRRMVDVLLDAADDAWPAPADLDPARLAGILVPHAGLVYSGIVAAAAWRLLPSAFAAVEVPGAPGVPRLPARGGETRTIVLLGTNHRAAWLDGIGAWVGGPWRTPLADVAVDDDLTERILRLGPPFAADSRCHLGEHSLEVQLPFIARLAPDARIVALAVGTGTGPPAIDAGERLGRLLAERRAGGAAVLLAISSDMAHYPAASVATAVTTALLPPILALDPAGLAVAEAEAAWSRPGVSCGMCGIEPAVLGLAALRAMGAGVAFPLAAATSADAGGDERRTVGYLAVGFAAA